VPWLSYSQRVPPWPIGNTPEQVAAASGGNVQVQPKSERTDTGGHSEIAAIGNFKMGGKTPSIGFRFDTITNGLECVLYNAMGDATWRW
jgi:hypothetical protein